MDPMTPAFVRGTEIADHSKIEDMFNEMPIHLPVAQAEGRRTGVKYGGVVYGPQRGGSDQ